MKDEKFEITNPILCRIFSIPMWRLCIYALLFGIAFGYVVFKCIFGLVYVPTTSMEPTIHADSVHLTWNLPYTFGEPSPKRGDIAVFFRTEDDVSFTKRVIGVAGDEVAILDDGVYVNGERLDEPYVMGQTIDTGNGPVYVVPEGCFFVLGDNREHSRDSRYFENPYIPVEAVIGVVLR